MSDLETKLRNLADRGELTYLSVVPTAGKGKGGVVFCAQVSPASRFGHSEGRDSDIAKAIHLALDGLPKSFVKELPKKRQAKTVAEATAEQTEREPWDIV